MRGALPTPASKNAALHTALMRIQFFVALVCAALVLHATGTSVPVTAPALVWGPADEAASILGAGLDKLSVRAPACLVSCMSRAVVLVRACIVSTLTPLHLATTRTCNADR